MSKLHIDTRIRVTVEVDGADPLVFELENANMHQVVHIQLGASVLTLVGFIKEVRVLDDNFHDKGDEP